MLFLFQVVLFVQTVLCSTRLNEKEFVKQCQMCTTVSFFKIMMPEKNMLVHVNDAIMMPEKNMLEHVNDAIITKYLFRSPYSQHIA